MELNNNYFILRHGKALSNHNRTVSSWPEKFDNPLTEKGQEQIRALISQLEKEKIDLIFSSDLLRTKQTAEIIAKALEIEVKFDQRLREISFGIFNGEQENDWNNFYKCGEERFVKRPENGGENYNDVRRRTEDFIKEIDEEYKNKNILIISHGCVLFSLQAFINGYDEEQEMVHRNELILKTGELRKL